jgi:hypothetical protein
MKEDSRFGSCFCAPAFCVTSIAAINVKENANAVNILIRLEVLMPLLYSRGQ